jgi:Rad3-related DNA helicase
MALLDKRVYEKNYGKYVLQALSEMEITNNLDIVIQKMGDKL